MKRPILLAAAVAALGSWGAASGKGPPPETPVGPVTAAGCCPRALLSGCPDDYCRKPWPRLWCLSCGLPNDYCPKPFPRLWRLGNCKLPDDYCRKPCPNQSRPPCPDNYTCGGPAPSRPTCPARDPAK
jgi:hypothetical protein